MNQALIALGPRASEREAGLLDRLGPEARSAAARSLARGAQVWERVARPVRGAHALRLWSAARLLEVTVLACAGLAVVRRTGGFAHLRRGSVRAAGAARTAWAKAEGFEMEASAGIALVVLAIVIVVHGLLTG